MQVATEYPKRFGDKIKRLAMHSQLTQAELARRVGMQPSHLNLFLQGRGDIHSQRFVDILSELGIDIESQLERYIAQKSGDLSDEKNPGVSAERVLAKLRKMSKAEMEAIALIVGKISKDQRPTKAKTKGVA